SAFYDLWNFVDVVKRKLRVAEDLLHVQQRQLVVQQEQILLLQRLIPHYPVLQVPRPLIAGCFIVRIETIDYDTIGK
ncbi:hypothetical protein X777_14599, partial [Ooceraea biroi]